MPIDHTLSWTQLQARARSCEAENDMTGALEYYDAALVAFPMPGTKDTQAKSVMRRLERERNQCQQAIWNANGGMPTHKNSYSNA